MLLQPSIPTDPGFSPFCCCDTDLFLQNEFSIKIQKNAEFYSISIAVNISIKVLFISCKYLVICKLQIFSDLDGLNLGKKDSLLLIQLGQEFPLPSKAVLNLPNFFFFFATIVKLISAVVKWIRWCFKQIQMPPLTFLGRSWLGRLQMAITGMLQPL